MPVIFARFSLTPALMANWGIELDLYCVDY